MDNVKLTYFAMKGTGEGIRLLLAYGGQEFEDIQIKLEEWMDFKPKTPHGTLPLFEFNGKLHTQSTAIARFLGHRFGLAGDTLEEDLLIDQNFDFFLDVRMKASLSFWEPDEEIKAKKQADLLNKEYPFLLPKLDKIIKENKGHLGAGKLTWADFAFAGIYDYFKVIALTPDMDEKYPSFKKLRDTVYNLPRVKEYSEKSNLA